MNEERKRTLLEAVGLLNDRRAQVHELFLSAQARLKHMPETERYEDIREDLSDAVESLDEVASLIGSLIADMEFALTDHSPSWEKINQDNWKRIDLQRVTPAPASAPKEHVSFFQKLLLGFGLAGAASRSVADESERARLDMDTMEDEDFSIEEDMIQMHSANPDADLEDHFGWDHKMDYDQDGREDAW